MNLTLRIEGDSKVVRDFIHYIRMDERYVFYFRAKYLFSPEKDQVEFVFARRKADGADSDEAGRERIS
jgi:hypothetical protein